MIAQQPKKACLLDRLGKGINDAKFDKTDYSTSPLGNNFFWIL
jgi:hypothetical protein